MCVGWGCVQVKFKMTWQRWVDEICGLWSVGLSESNVSASRLPYSMGLDALVGLSLTDRGSPVVQPLGSLWYDTTCAETKMVKNGVERRLVFISEGLSWELKGGGRWPFVRVIKMIFFLRSAPPERKSRVVKGGEKKLFFQRPFYRQTVNRVLIVVGW